MTNCGQVPIRTDASRDCDDMALLRALIFVACRAALTRAQSQGAQDYIIADIFDRIGVTNGYYVEIGFNSPTFEGGTGANTWALHRRGWRGLLLDRQFENASINLVRAEVTSANVAGLLLAHGAPLEPDYVSIDIDSGERARFCSLARAAPRLSPTPRLFLS